MLISAVCRVTLPHTAALVMLLYSPHHSCICGWMHSQPKLGVHAQAQQGIVWCRYAALRAESEAAQLDNCTFSPRINPWGAPPSQGFRSPAASPGRSASRSAAKPLPIADATNTMPPEALLQPVGTLASGITMAYKPRHQHGVVLTAKGPVHHDSECQPAASARRMDRAGPLDSEASSSAGREPVGNRLYQTGRETVQRREELRLWTQAVCPSSSTRPYMSSAAAWPQYSHAHIVVKRLILKVTSASGSLPCRSGLPHVVAGAAGRVAAAADVTTPPEQGSLR